MSNPVDFEIGSSPREGQHQGKDVNVIQNQVDEVVGILRTNVTLLSERGEKLSELDQRADQLSASAAEFQTTSRKVKKKYWWQNMKMMLLLGGVSTLIIIIIIISIVGIPSSSDSDEPSSSSENSSQ